MSEKQVIKDLFEAELVNCPQYPVAVNLVQYLKDEIARPLVSEYVQFFFNNAMTDQEQGTFRMCVILLLGFEPITVSGSYCVVHMKNFLI